MNSKIALLILLIVAIIAVAGLVLFYKSTTGAATYQQLIHRNPEVFLPYYNVCARGPCGAQAVQIGEVQSEESAVTRTAICSCPNGQSYQIDYRKPY
ncbi:hypothetical protein KY310_04075 [Candidatus Woesearchaeota archaeon]|nr:hypothetical protein [Candidatus Woesearchaeota archaeon]